MHLQHQLKAIACHLTALLWMPIGIILAWGISNSPLGRIMFLGSLALAGDWGHSANFAGIAWLVFIVLGSMLLILWIPLAIALNRQNMQTPNKLIHRSSINVFNWLLSCILILIISTIIVEWLDRLVSPPHHSPWVTWSLVFLVAGMAIGQLILALRACLGILQGQSKRYFFAIPFLR
jgi:heme/copper-type cytochrome/quinol oxidase subunit 2